MSEAIYVNAMIGKEEHQHACQIECLCPRCTSDNIKLNGHETTVKGAPQKCYCRDCGTYFFPHTSYHVKHLHDDLKDSIGKCVEGGRFNASVLKAAVPASLSAIYGLLAAIISIVNQSITAKAYWAEKIDAIALFIDETFITIKKKTWYLIVIINEKGRVLGFDIFEHRDAETILELIDSVSKRLNSPFTHLVTDGFSSYKKVAKLIGRDLVHVQHIHKPPYGRVIITQLTHTPEKIILKRFATMNDILADSNGFVGQFSVSEVSKTKKKIGRPKGSKDKKKRAPCGSKKEGKKENEKQTFSKRDDGGKKKIPPS